MVIIIVITVEVTITQAVHEMQHEAHSKALAVKQIEQQLASTLEEEGSQHERVLALDAKGKEIEDKVSHRTRAAHRIRRMYIWCLKILTDVTSVICPRFAQKSRALVLLLTPHSSVLCVCVCVCVHSR